MSATPSSGPSVAQLRRHWLPGAAIGMIFLISPAVAIVTSHHPLALRLLGLFVVLGTGFSYLVLTPSSMTWPLPRQLAFLFVLVLVSGLAWPAVGSDLVVFWIFIGISGGAVLSMRNTAIVVGVLAVGMIGITRVDQHAPPWGLAGFMIGLSLWMCSFMGNIRLTRELRETRQELADAAVAAERERIGRDLHDILGHSLTAIAIKAGLARRLVERRADGAAREIADVERLAREALADVRATASGFREVSVGSEIAVAAMVLRAAGISPHLPVAVDDVDPAARELFGYVVREAVTNVVRHSGAQNCTVRIGGSWVEIADDGAGAATDAMTGGSGLAGLCDRVRAAGGVLQAGSRTAGGFLVRAELPAPGAASKPGDRPSTAAPADVPPELVEPAGVAAEQPR